MGATTTRATVLKQGRAGGKQGAVPAAPKEDADFIGWALAWWHEPEGARRRAC